MKTVKCPRKRVVVGNTILCNIYFSKIQMISLYAIIFTTWLVILIQLLGDVHPNPGPEIANTSFNSVNMSSHNSSSYSLTSMCTHLSHHLSIVHHNVQSILKKIDLLQSELYNFDIIALTETWLNTSVANEDIMFPSFHQPER